MRTVRPSSSVRVTGLMSLVGQPCQCPVFSVLAGSELTTWSIRRRSGTAPSCFVVAICSLMRRCVCCRLSEPDCRITFVSRQQIVQDLLTFQNTGSAPFRIPVRLLRYADGGRYWPSGTNGTVSNARSWISASSFLRSASSVASIQALRNASIFSSFGQPNQASLPLPRRFVAKTGSRYSAAGAPYGNSDQPPLSNGSLLVRRCTTVPQSKDCSSRLIPTRRSDAATTLLMAS